jgi:hypothetical protein
MNERPSVIHLTAAELAAMGGDDGHDTPFRDRQSVVLCHGMSPELQPGSARYAPGAAIGDYVVPQGDKRVVFKGQAGFVAQIIGFSLSHPEYTVGVGDDRGQYVDDHGVNPPKDMRWFKAGESGVAKAGYYRTAPDGKPGNKVVPTVTAYMLVDGYGVAYAMYGTAYKVGRELVIRAERLRVKVEVDGKTEELRSCILGKYKFTSAFEKKAFTYPVPAIQILGKLGEANGPTEVEYRNILPLRQALRAGGDWTPMETLDPPAPPGLLLPKQGHNPDNRTVNDNGAPAQRSEADPPPAEGDGRNWEIDDGIPF